MFPKLIQFGDSFLPSYGVMVALAFLAGLYVTTRLARRVSLPEEKVTNLVIYCALMGLLGAKLFMILFDLPTYLANPGEIFTLATLQAAGVYQGGFLLALGFAIYYMRQQSLPPLLTMDTFAPGLALGHAVGRIGCFLAGCCYGAQCDLPWAVHFHDIDAYKLTGVPLEVGLHPTQLYESAFNFGLFALLYKMYSQPRPAGQLFAIYLVLYSVFRFCVEFVRHHEQELKAGLSNTQWISVATLLAGIYLWQRSQRHLPARPA
jgi:phosphatidylglycerol---prolipoprotein diacylglyceryl transferase